ncbi:uncharacterized protein LOC127451316 isoform X10 [Myxocyprinus asiaticus]|uniref:uncharacterized protein LOC127451316 isoform X9 n=1 Tax=Myxocyprinus asiaticus TaxID=70543 RepID=UPI00222203EA|nr:uncharacterized protein LOC127451316 isoform X9 [Myxocyprinus asiaticus]XP_051571864.1 uncharacterized protein LOC127451316 isoform X10 [Myxocyprinus asiaticus]
MLIIFYTLLTVLSSLFYSTAHLYTQHTPNHKMMTIFCTFCTLLTCVSGVTVVTQNPSVLTVNKGQKVTLNCNMGTVINSARWYKQTPGGVPQYVLNFQHDWRVSLPQVVFMSLMRSSLILFISPLNSNCSSYRQDADHILHSPHCSVVIILQHCSSLHSTHTKSQDDDNILHFLHSSHLCQWCDCSDSESSSSHSE